MKKQREPELAKDTEELEEPLGHISVPIADTDLEQIHLTLTQHGASLQKIRTPDNWWLIFFPNGTKKTNKKTENQITTSIVQLPDGFSFLLQEGVFNRGGTYAIPPQIVVQAKTGEST